MTSLEEKSLVSILVVCCLAGCGSTKQFTLPEDRPAFAGNVTIGDQVSLVTLEGEIHEFTVAEFSEYRVCGADVCYDYQEVAGIAVENFSLLRTGAVAVGTFLALTLVAAATVGSVL